MGALRSWHRKGRTPGLLEAGVMRQGVPGKNQIGLKAENRGGWRSWVSTVIQQSEGLKSFPLLAPDRNMDQRGKTRAQEGD
jgi:hypothetical protein